MKASFVVLFALGIVFLTPAAANAQGAAPVRLADLEAEALRAHPAIEASARMVDAKRARVAQARALPDPQLSIGYMGDPAPFDVQVGDPSSYRTIGVMQEIPYPGKLALRGRIAAKEAEAETWNTEAVRRRILAEVRMTFFEMASVDKALEITARNKDLLEKFARIAEERYKVGQGLQQDVLRAQVEVSRILQRLTVLRQRRGALEAQMNSLLFRAPDTPIGALAPMEKSPLVYSLDELLEHAVSSSPEIRRQERLIEQSQLAMDLARKEYYPDFSIGWDYQQRPQMPEMYGLRFTVNLPFFQRKKRDAMVNEAGQMQASARQMREAMRTELLWKVKEQYLAARASDDLLALYAKAVVPQSTLALESSLSSYQTGAIDFLSVITNFTTVLDYEISYYEELASHQKALARMEEITGVPLVEPQATPGVTPESGKEVRQP